MDQTREQLEKQPPTSTGLGADMKRLKTDATATTEELREFITSLKGRSPQEVLGKVSNSGLVRATVQATIGCIVLLAIMSIGPWWWNSDEAAVASAATNAAAVETNAKPSSTDTDQTATSDNTATETRSGTDTPTGRDAAQAASAMKIDETVVTDPDKNPLDSNLDSLLDGLD